MPKKTYKNKGVPVKGSEVRFARNIRLSDSAWSGLDEVAKILNSSRGDLIEFWAAVLTHNEEKIQEIAANEKCSVDELMNRLFELLPDGVRQAKANQPPKGFPVRVKPPKDNTQQQ